MNDDGYFPPTGNKSVWDSPFWDPVTAPTSRFELSRQLSKETSEETQVSNSETEKNIRAASWKDLLSMAQKESETLSNQGRFISESGLPPSVRAAMQKAAWQLSDLINVSTSEARESLIGRLKDRSTKSSIEAVKYLRSLPYDIEDEREEEQAELVAKSADDVARKSRVAKRMARIAAEATQSRHPEALYLVARAARAAKAVKAARTQAHRISKGAAE